MKLFSVTLLSALLLSCIKDKTHDETVYIQTDSVNAESYAIDTSLNARRDSIVAFAEQYIGTKYCYAGTSPEKGFDCSGFVYYVFNNFGIDVPRSSSGFKNLGTALNPDEFKKGDVLVFYGYQDSNSIGHVGIVYEVDGMNSTFIHASSGSEYAVTTSELNSDMYTRRFYKCIDVISQ